MWIGATTLVALTTFSFAWYFARQPAAEAPLMKLAILPLENSSFDHVAISPDGRWLAFTSDTTGRNEIYVRHLGEDLSLGPQFRVSTEGGQNPDWFARGPGQPMQIVYDSDRKVPIVTLTTTPEVRLSKPTILGDSRDHPAWRTFVGLPDGRFLMRMAGEEEGPPKQFDIVLNWGADLSRRLAAGRAGP